MSTLVNRAVLKATPTSVLKRLEQRNKRNQRTLLVYGFALIAAFFLFN